ncbi:MAG TPA: hypothetical protein VGM73_13535 [Candidatus Didemnitutus sp.]|jgi:hypothetical protein
MNHATVRPRGRIFTRFLRELVEAGWSALHLIEGQVAVRRRVPVRVESRHGSPTADAARRKGGARRMR